MAGRGGHVLSSVWPAVVRGSLWAAVFSIVVAVQQKISSLGSFFYRFRFLSIDWRRPKIYT